MTILHRFSRRHLFEAGGTLAVASVLPGIHNHPMTPASAEPGIPMQPAMHNVAYCTILNDGKWIGPRNADGTADLTVVDDIIQRSRGADLPSYVRVTEASYVLGTETPAADSDGDRAIRKLVEAGIGVGVAINVLRKSKPASGCPVGWDDPVIPERCVRTVEDNIAQAKMIREAAGALYDWIFLDFAWGRTPVGVYGLDDLQQVIDGIAAAGWDRIMINATGFPPDGFDQIPQRLWGSARHFGLLNEDDWQGAVADAIAGRRRAITDEDEAFADFITHFRPDSHAVLKLEIPTQIQKLRQLSTDDQNRLLTLWARAQQPDQLKMIYPLFTHGDHPLGNQARQYDSRVSGTFWTQRQLMLQTDRQP